jgi:hypothetical protein
MAWTVFVWGIFGFPVAAPLPNPVSGVGRSQKLCETLMEK